MTVAALYVEKDGVYFGLPDVDPWDEARDARRYAGPHPVVAHPPCARWSQLAGLVESRYGYKRGEDGGCFKAALASVRSHGGVLEHPAETRAWPAFDLPAPVRAGGWTEGAGGWVCQVSQVAYGHVSQKKTWLYYVGSRPPDLDWRTWRTGYVVTTCRGETRQGAKEIPKKLRSRTPIPFRDLLLDLARGAA